MDEKKNKRIAFATSAGLHLLLLILFLLSMAWRAPDPPLPEFGIEINFGTSDVGTGDDQPEAPTATEEQDQQVTDEAATEEEQEQLEEQVPEEVATSKEESPVEEEKTEKPVEEKKEVIKPKETDTKKTEESTAKKPSSTEGSQPVSQGNDKDKIGDKGIPKGTTADPNAAYTGKPGGGAGGDGMVLSMSGWAWADTPKTPNIPDNEDGRIVFEIECDEEGDIVGIKTLERGLSLKAEQMLIEEIRKNSLVRTSGGQTPERSKGKVVFVLKTR